MAISNAVDGNIYDYILPSVAIVTGTTTLEPFEWSKIFIYS